jgi:C-terminal processing protease CtpA/Prc
LLIVGLEADSPAGMGGLIVGDILVGVAGEPIEHHDELFARLSGECGRQSHADGRSARREMLQVVNVVVGER